jgi:hypothetical protein
MKLSNGEDPEPSPCAPRSTRTRGPLSPAAGRATIMAPSAQLSLPWQATLLCTMPLLAAPPASAAPSLPFGADADPVTSHAMPVVEVVKIHGDDEPIADLKGKTTYRLNLTLADAAENVYVL